MSKIKLLERLICEEMGLSHEKSRLEFLGNLSKEIPQDLSNLSSGMAERLAGRFLKGSDVCAELYAAAIGYELKKEVRKKRAYGDSFFESTSKTVKEKEADASRNDKFLDASDLFAEAKMIRVFIEEKKSLFDKAHYLMKQIASKEPLNASSRFDESHSIEEDDEEEE